MGEEEAETNCLCYITESATFKFTHQEVEEHAVASVDHSAGSIRPFHHDLVHLIQQRVISSSQCVVHRADRLH